ncbi:MAG: FUSC family protein, partial [Rhodoglobus sp.]
IPSTRMAIQLAAAVAVAFALAFWLFPAHWGWVVLTAYLVSAGNRGRADVLYKSGLRIAGAAAGSIAAVAVAGVHLEGPPLVAVVIGAVGIGLVLRNLSYAFWALIVTLALTVLQGGLGAQPVELWPRVLAILVGAACGVLAAWFILPIRSENVLRRRIADALASLDAYLATGALTDGSLAGGSPAPTTERIDEVAKPFEALARVPFAPARWRRAGEWAALTTLALELATDGGDHRAARRQLGEARRALREPERLGATLRELVAALR